MRSALIRPMLPDASTSRMVLDGSGGGQLAAPIS